MNLSPEVVLEISNSLFEAVAEAEEAAEGHFVLPLPPPPPLKIVERAGRLLARYVGHFLGL